VWWQEKCVCLFKERQLRNTWLPAECVWGVLTLLTLMSSSHTHQFCGIRSGQTSWRQCFGCELLHSDSISIICSLQGLWCSSAGANGPRASASAHICANLPTSAHRTYQHRDQGPHLLNVHTHRLELRACVR